MPTLGSDFYTGKVRNPLRVEEKKEEIVHAPTVSIQMWDTAGRERKAKYTAALSDSFFQHADAAMLVYDATSSTSFTQLLRWYSDLMERMEELNRSLDWKMPVLIVANKVDLVEKMGKDVPERRRPLSSQRDVLGLSEAQFKGKDYTYEYNVTQSTSRDNDKKAAQTTYMATGDSWTKDGSYLESVQNTEDTSHPDRDMVVLWCKRNGLKHVEVSALDGTLFLSSLFRTVLLLIANRCIPT